MMMQLKINIIIDVTEVSAIVITMMMQHDLPPENALFLDRCKTADSAV